MADVYTPLQCFGLCFLALNLLITGSSLDMHGKCWGKKTQFFSFFSFNLVEKLQKGPKKTKQEFHTFHKEEIIFETSADVRVAQT